MSGGEETDWSYAPVPTLSSILDNGNSFTTGRHASLMSRDGTQMREGGLTGPLTGQRVNYLDSGYSEDDPDQQVTSCLMKTPSGSIYIPTNKPKNMTIDSRLEYRFTQSPNQSPTKDSLKNSDRSTLKYGAAVHHSSSGLSPSLRKSFSSKCSWRCTAVFFIVLTLALTAALVYVTATSLLPVSYESAKACAVVVENDVDQQRMEPVHKPGDSTTSLQPRNLPPDGTTFSQISLNQRLSQSIPPYGYWNVQFYQPEAGYVSLDLSVPRGASLGFYARRNALPTHTHYNFMEVINGLEGQRAKRASMRSVGKVLNLYLSEGHWFLSFYNDDGEEQELGFHASPADEMTKGCPMGCNGHGECVLGRCQCQAGYAGEDCSQSVCPLLCTGHGEYRDGECHCDPGWKGKECRLRREECQIPDCSGHGQCQEGACVCMKGYTGEFCQKVDCPDPNCSDHGFCVEGACVCKKGWKGPDCSDLDDDARQCLPDCSGQGRFDLESQLCVCHPGWSGQDCSVRMCGLDCGQHGSCEDDRCVCTSGWTGPHCEMRSCDPRCSLHGQCKNGTCLCVTGWNGRHCTLEGCPKQCSDRGSCRADFRGEWACSCHEGWDGEDCSGKLERNCDDGQDDDGDGLTDCEDPECCDSPTCDRSQLCSTVPRPIDILLQRQPPAATASFFQKMRFIIEEGSLQRYAQNTAFNESLFWNYFNQSRVAVLRGRVETSSGRGLVGVRVTHASFHTEGYTMTQEDGWFDFMVNGGGAVTLKFGKSPFPPQIRTLFVPWNEVIVIDPVVMSMHSPMATLPSTATCDDHDYETMKPIVLATWKLSVESLADKSAILVESQVLQELLPIPNSKINLVYHSSRSRGYLSTIRLQLTPASIPTTLQRILLRITIEGVLFERTFEADPNLKYTYSWDRLNIYRQRVYGTTTAVVKVGYIYTNCAQTIWNIQTTKISGQDLKVSDVGGWDIDVHHRFNHQEGILYKGDGSNIFLKERPRLIFTTMGDGHQRTMDCDRQCEGFAAEQRLLSPVSIVAGSDGSLYVGDFNLIRRIFPDGRVKTLLKLNSTRVSYKYHLAVHPHDGSLYVSDPELHQIIRVTDVETWERVVGVGTRCLPGDEDACGDGGLARDARLSYPKGLAISADNTLYFADGTNIRKVDSDGIISTVIGSHVHRTHWKPLPCEGTIAIEEVVPRWPTELAVNPLDNTLHFIDDNMVMKLTVDSRIQVVAGRPLHCHRPRAIYMNFASHATLVSPQSVAFSPTGQMFVAESDSRRTNRISVVGTDGRITPFAGRESRCNCLDAECACFSSDNVLALESVFGSISSIAVSPNDGVFVCDQANKRVRAIHSSIPGMNSRQEYEVYSPETQEVFLFNRFGLHMSTKSIPTGQTVYSFSYSVSTSSGRLVGIQDASGGKISVLRDYAGQVSAIENTLRQKFELEVDRKRMLTAFKKPSNFSVSFSYYRTSELIHSRRDSDGNSFVYEYDGNGRLESVVTPTGELIRLESDLDIRGAIVNVTRNGETDLSVLLQPNLLHKVTGREVEVIQMELDRSFITESKWGHKFTLKTAPYALLQDTKGLAESFPVPFREKTDIGKDTINRFEWKYFVNGGRDATRVGKKLRVSGDNILSVELDRRTGSQAVALEKTQAMINVSESRDSLRISTLPSGLFATVSLEKNHQGLPVAWRWGDMSREFVYDNMNRLEKLVNADGSFFKYFYTSPQSDEPSKVTVPTGGTFLFNRDDNGALEAILTPRGHIHQFARQHSFGYTRFLYNAPWAREPYELQFDQSGRLAAMVYPGETAKVIYVYEAKQLKAVIGGAVAVNYHYDKALVKSIEVGDETFEMKTDLRYHLGLLKEVRNKMDGDFDGSVIKYQYDGNGRVSAINMEIGENDKKVISYSFNAKSGLLEGVDDLRMRRESLRKVVVEDVSKSFIRIKDLDIHGRLRSLTVRIKGYECFNMNLEYDSGNRLRSRSVSINHQQSDSRFKYNANGQLEMVEGQWEYGYDVNGNVVTVTREGKPKVTLGYDSGDRVDQYRDTEFVSYDDRGFVVRRGEQYYTYNGLGQMQTAFEAGRFSIQFFYDDMGRLLAKKDHRGNVIQFLYSNPHKPNLVTHVRYPKAARTYRLYHDEEDMLIVMETTESRYFVSTDQLGTPVVAFDGSGNIVKELVHSPFGLVLHDSNPTLDLPIDYAGGLVDQYTRLIHFKEGVYDPLLGQWMNPQWTKVGQDMTSPFQLFAYRFRNNDPINKEEEEENHMTSITNWLRLFGLHLPSMIGSSYAISTLHQPSHGRPSRAELQISVGLERIQQRALSNFLQPDLSHSTTLTHSALGPPNLTPRISRKPCSFGDGLLLTRVGDQVRVSLVDGYTDVVQSVFASILNASKVLDISLSGREEFYFLKEDHRLFSDDFQELQRLSGSFNVTKEAIRPAGMQMCAKDKTSKVCVLYGTDSRQASRHLMRSAHKEAAEKAWAREAQRIKMGFKGAWAASEVAEVVRRPDKVPHGYEASEVHSVHRYPQLIGQSSNIVFGKKSKRQRRRKE